MPFHFLTAWFSHVVVNLFMASDSILSLYLTWFSHTKTENLNAFMAD